MSEAVKLLVFLTVVLLISLNITLHGQYYSAPTVSGDANLDGQICMDDSILIINSLWRNGRELPCPDAADVDRDGSVTIGDVVYGLRHVFFGEYIPDCPVTCY